MRARAASTAHRDPRARLELVDGLAPTTRAAAERRAPTLAPSGVRVVCSCATASPATTRALPHLSRKEYDGKVKRGELAASTTAARSAATARGWVVYDLAPPTVGARPARARGARARADARADARARFARARARARASESARAPSLSTSTMMTGDRFLSLARPLSRSRALRARCCARAQAQRLVVMRHLLDGNAHFEAPPSGSCSRARRTTRRARARARAARPRARARARGRTATPSPPPPVPTRPASPSPFFPPLLWLATRRYEAAVRRPHDRFRLEALAPVDRFRYAGGGFDPEMRQPRLGGDRLVRPAADPGRRRRAVRARVGVARARTRRRRALLLAADARAPRAAATRARATRRSRRPPPRRPRARPSAAAATPRAAPRGSTPSRCAGRSSSRASATPTPLRAAGTEPVPCAAAWRAVATRTDELFVVAEALRPAARRALEKCLHPHHGVPRAALPGPELSDPVAVTSARARAAPRAHARRAQFNDGEADEACARDALGPRPVVVVVVVVARARR